MIKLVMLYKLKLKNNVRNPGVVASAVIPCDGTVEIGRLDAVNPPVTLVGSKIRTRTELFQLVGEKYEFQSTNFLPKGQKRRSEGFNN